MGWICQDVWNLSQEIRPDAEVSCRYAGYVQRQKELADRGSELDSVLLPDALEYSVIAGLTTEAKEKLTAVRPRTLGQAGRIPGITPAALTCIEIQLKKLSHAGKSERV